MVEIEGKNKNTLKEHVLQSFLILIYILCMTFEHSLAIILYDSTQFLTMFSTVLRNKHYRYMICYPAICWYEIGKGANRSKDRSMSLLG